MSGQFGGLSIPGGPLPILGSCLLMSAANTATSQTFILFLTDDYLKMVAVTYTIVDTNIFVKAVEARYKEGELYLLSYSNSFAFPPSVLSLISHVMSF